MKKILIRTAIVLMVSVPSVQAQQGPAYYQPAPTQRYYYPSPYGNYPANAAPAPVYYPPRANYYPSSQGSVPYSAPTNFPFSTPPVITSSQAPGANPYGAPQSYPFSAPSSTQEIVVTPSTEERYNPAPAGAALAPGAGSSDKQYVLSDLWARIAHAVDPTGVRAAAPYCRTPNEKFWVSADYLGAFSRPMRFAAPLLTTGSISDTHPGALGQPSTAVLYGDSPVNYNLMTAISLQAGVFLDDENHFSIQGGGFISLQSRQTFTKESDGNGNPLLARPVFATDVGQPLIFLTSFPGQFTGKFSVENTSQFDGAEFNAAYHTYSHQHLHTETLVGFRYLRLAESMQIQDTNVTGINGFFTPFPPVGGGATNFATYSDVDSFSTLNQFFGAQVGSRVTWEGKWVSLGIFGKLGFGATVQHVDINGSTTFTNPGSQTAPGGVLALPSNIGSYSRTVFGLVPEVGLDLGVNVCEHVRLHLGYSALVWNRVVRPGMAFDPNVNTALAPTGTLGANVTGPIAPLFRFNDEAYWLQSFKLGVEFHY